MNKSTLFRPLALSIVALAVSACGNLSNISDEGTTDKPVFPKISGSLFNNQEGSQFGSWPNWDNVRQIERGMNKSQLYQLIGHPHFTDGLYGVREWDYVFNYRENGEHKICQYKILFDKNMEAQSFFWYPNGCNGNSSFDLTADFLFDFDKDTLTEKGHETLEQIASQIVSYNVQYVKVEGYADRLGETQYNLGLSQRRADRVKSHLQQKGVNVDIEAVGYGKANQVKACEHERGERLKECLAPNRRVVISSNGGMSEQEDNNSAGPKGPSLLYSDQK